MQRYLGIWLVLIPNPTPVNLRPFSKLIQRPPPSLRRHLLSLGPLARLDSVKASCQHLVVGPTVWLEGHGWYHCIFSSPERLAINVVLKWMLHRMTTRGEWRMDRKWLMSPYFCRLHWMTSSDYDTWWLQKVRIFGNG